MNKKRIFTLVMLFFFVSVFFTFSQTADGRDIIKSGLEKFTKGQYSGAVVDFREILLHPSYEKLYDAAYFWIARSYMEEKLLSKAETNLEFFIQNFSGSRFYPEALYQKGRLLYMQEDYENAIQILYTYLKQYPHASYAANSYFWIAESLYALGQFDKARQLYAYLIKEYPTSYKVETSRYKLSLITLKKHEEELLRLLRLSHEEYLNVVDDFQKREKTYEQALAGYQRKLLAASNNDTKKLLKELNGELAKKDQEIASLNRQLMEEKKKGAIPSDSGENTVPQTKSVRKDTEVLSQLLDLKGEALDLKAYYVDWLRSKAGE